jgi:hypothetical protein
VSVEEHVLALSRVLMVEGCMFTGCIAKTLDKVKGLYIAMHKILVVSFIFSNLKHAEFYSDSSTHAILCCVAGDLFEKFNFLRSLFAYEFAFYAAWAEKVSSKFSVLKINYVTNCHSYGLLLLRCYKC